jgi:hypothetical protein
MGLGWQARNDARSNRGGRVLFGQLTYHNRDAWCRGFKQQLSPSGRRGSEDAECAVTQLGPVLYVRQEILNRNRMRCKQTTKSRYHDPQSNYSVGGNCVVIAEVPSTKHKAHSVFRWKIICQEYISAGRF